MRSSRQSGEGANLSTYSKNHAPASVARLSANTASAAAAAGSSRALAVQLFFIAASVPAPATSNLPILKAEARPSGSNVIWKQRHMEGGPSDRRRLRPNI